jgi:primary-amine oxidase
MTNAADARINHTRTAFLGTAVLLTLIAPSPALKAQNPKHPLDSLTSPEYWITYEVLHASGKEDADTRYPMVQLKEPPKEEALAWKLGQPIPREAFVVVWKGMQTFEAVVDLKGKQLVSWTEVKGIQPNSVREEGNEIIAVVMADAGLQATLKRGGITDLNSVFRFVNTLGYFGNADEEGRRLFRVECGQSFGAREDAGPISGLTVVSDADAKKVLRVIDTEIVPIVPVPGNFDKSSVGPLREVPGPITMQQLLGQNGTHSVTAARVSRASQADQHDQSVGTTSSDAGSLADVGPRL